jgi:hypothetical protein
MRILATTAHGHQEPPLSSPDDKHDEQKILCHAPGDRCHGCDHYKGKAPVCSFAPSAALPTGAPSQRRLSGDRLTEVISWAETNATAFAKFPESEKSPADYLWMLCLAVLDLRDDVLEALRSNRSATERTIPADQMHVLDVYAGLESELRDLADRLRATYSGSAMRGLRSVGEWEMDTRKKSMCEAGLRLLASVVATRRSDSRGDSDA